MTSFEYWESLPASYRIKLARRYPKMSLQGLRLWAWRRRDWEPVKRDEVKCKCNKLHLSTCPNSNNSQAMDDTNFKPSEQ